MPLAVAWADWIISCCGVGSETMSPVLDGLIMVRLGKPGRGIGYKSAYISGTIGLIYFKLIQGVGEGVPYH